MERLLNMTFSILLVGAVMYVLMIETIRHYAEWQIAIQTKSIKSGAVEGSASPDIVFESEQVGRYELITKSEYPHTHMVLDTISGIIYDYSADTEQWYSFDLKNQSREK